ncbi:hypothetical protein SDC9_124661 [bioreactor metagenome]|uniref:Uncharacterized protein n=1 Tax=bioreactor metagenome TaxID=1076179 RepID=A0A645CL49_9ZZZZ
MVELAHCFNRVFTQRFAVCAGGIRLRRAVRNLRVNDDKRRMRFVRFCGLNGVVDRADIFAVRKLLHRPAVRFEALTDIFGKRKIRAAFNGNLVAVVEQNQLAEAKMPRQRSRFGSDAFHQAAVAGKDVSIMIDYREPFAVELGGEPRFRHRHADCCGDALSQRAGCRFYTDRVTKFRMPGCFAPPLAKTLEFIHRQTVAEQMQQRIFQHGSVPCREDEPVAPRPLGVGGIVLHLLPKCERHGSSADGQAGMAAFCFLNGFRREKTNVGDCFLLNCLHVFYIPFVRLYRQRIINKE